MKYYVADFETTTDENDCRVWGYGIVEIGKLYNFEYGNNLDDFMYKLEASKGNCKVWFHNLRFDGTFIINWLDSHNFKYVEKREDATDMSYTSLITSEGIFYRIEVYFERDRASHTANKVTFYDSVKIINSSVEQIAKDFHLEVQKGSIDYKKPRPKGYKLTTEEIGYIRNDVEIVATALGDLFKLGINKSTIGLSALDNFKKIQKNYNKMFPSLPVEYDDEIRKTYKGGYTYVNPKYKGKVVGAGIVLDCNSEYPSVMADEKNLFPFGYPEMFYGEYKYDPYYPLYLICFSCIFKLKEGKLPTIQVKDSPFCDPTDYLESSDDLPMSMIMTSVDYELFREHYDVENLKFIGGYKFKGYSGVFSKYMNYWNEIKMDSKKNNNWSKYIASKKMMNSLFGRFGIHTDNFLKKPIRMADGLVHFDTYKSADRKSAYTAVASFVTAYGRAYLIRSAQKIRDWGFKKYGEDLWLYGDTDSIKVLLKNRDEDLEDIKKIIEVDDYKLGAFKVESEFTKAKYLRAKAYIEQELDGKLNVVIAGFPKGLTPLLNFDNFDHGFTTKGMSLEELVKMAKDNGATDEQISKISNNLKYKYVKGGVILEESGFTIN